jgi:hypothetical protein
MDPTNEYLQKEVLKAKELLQKSLEVRCIDDILPSEVTRAYYSIHYQMLHSLFRITCLLFIQKIEHLKV